MAIPLDPDNLTKTAAWVRSLFPGPQHRYSAFLRKNINLDGKLYELEGNANDGPNNQSFGSFLFQLYPERRKGTHDRSATLHFYVHNGSLEWVNLKYVHGLKPLYLDTQGEPPSTWAEYLKQGEEFNRLHQTDPPVDPVASRKLFKL